MRVAVAELINPINESHIGVSRRESSRIDHVAVAGSLMHAGAELRGSVLTGRISHLPRFPR